MNENLKNTLNFYYTMELRSFKESLYFSDMRNLAIKFGYEVESDFSFSENDKSVYLGFEVVDNSGKTVWVDGNYEGYLSYATLIAKFDKKSRVKFFHWEEDSDFIDSIISIIDVLKFEC